ncbi:MAG: alpha-glucosidase [Spirochaetales bacterium]|nr:alpha-glucosidase [Spirochaetales bacterium]
MLSIIDDSGLKVSVEGRVFALPHLSVGNGSSDISMYRGNFKVRERHIKWNSLDAKVSGPDVLYSGHGAQIRLHPSCENGFLTLSLELVSGSFNRFMLAFEAECGEAVFGGGEQYSYLNLRGHRFPIMTREQGVGRRYNRPLTILAQLHDKAGGAYHTTYYPQPTFVSSRNYFLHVHSFDYCVLDFKAHRSHRIISYSLPDKITVGFGTSLMDTASKVSLLLGRQAVLPSWVHDGMILGVQGGTDVVREKLERSLSHNVRVCALWAQDWSGKIVTSFGKRVLWDWKWNPEMYPGLDRWIGELRERGICFTTYINPYLIKGKSLCNEAVEKGYLVKNAAGEDYFIDFGEFDCGHVDLTNPEAFSWYKEKIKRNMLEFGSAGWMADFGEYLPTDAAVHSKVPGTVAHNMWPGLWAKLNHEALEETGNLDKVIFFMRSGNAMSPRYAQSIWAGDQNVDWSRDDGIRSVIPAALSLAYSGHGISFSDIGGYTTVAWLKRSKELLLRWTQMSCFTPVMRTHEGNRPASNWQFDSDDQTLDYMAYWSDLHLRLKDYIMFCEKENADKGLSVMRPMNWYSSESWALNCTDQYMLGPDMLVAPVMKKGAKGRNVCLPEGEWVNLFSGKHYKKGIHFIESQATGRSIPVFYRADCSWAEYFGSLIQA